MQKNINSYIKILLIILATIIYIAILFKSYTGNYKSVQIFLWPKTLGLADFQYDYFIQNSNHVKLTIIYHLLSFLKLNLDNDIVGFVIYFLFVSLSGFFTYKIINEYFAINNTINSVIVLFSLVFINGFLIWGNISSWITTHSATSTFFAWSLIPLFIWCLLSKNFFILLLLSSLMLLIGIKASWFVIISGAFFTIYQYKIKNSYWIIGPVLVFIYFSNFPTEIIDIESRIFFFETVLARDLEETAYHLQPKLNLALLIFSFPINFYIISKLKFKNEVIKNYLFLLLFLSISTFIFFYFYVLYGKDIYPEPRLLALSGTRALGIYELFFWISICCFIFNLKIKFLYKILINLFIAYATTKSTIAFFSISFTIVSIILLSKIFKQFFEYLNRDSLKLQFLFFIILLPGILYVLISKINTNFSLYSFNSIGKWSVNSLTKDKKRLTNAIKLRSCSDFLLLDLDYFPHTNAISLKSSFRGNIESNYFNKKLVLEVTKRESIVEKLKEDFNIGNNISSNMIGKLFNYEVTLIIKNKYIKLFPKEITKFDIGNGEHLLFFLNNKKVKELNNNCLKKIAN